MEPSFGFAFLWAEPAAGEARRPGVGGRQEAEPVQNPPTLRGS